MRGGRRTGVGARRGGRGDARNHSPIRLKIKEHRSGNHKNAVLPHELSRRSLSPQAWRLHRSPVRRSPSIEQCRERDFTLRRLEHGKHRSASLDDESFGFQHNYALAEHDMMDSHWTIKGKDLAGSNPSMDAQRVLVQRSLYLDDGPKRTFYTLPGESRRPFDPIALNPSENIQSIGMPRYEQLLRDPYDAQERDELYSKDVSFPLMPPSSQARVIVDASSSRFSNGTGLLWSYGERGCFGKFADELIDYNGNDTRSAPKKPHDELAPRERVDHGLYTISMYGSRGEFRDAKDSTFLDLARGRVDRADAYGEEYSEGGLWDFRDMRGVREDHVGTYRRGYAGRRPRSSRDHELPQFEDHYHFGIDVASVDYRERPNSPLLVERPLDVFRHSSSPPRHMEADFGAHDLSPERMFLRRNHINVHRRLQSPVYDDELWYSEESNWFPSQHRLPSHKRCRDDERGASSDSLGHGEVDRRISLNNRLRFAPSNSHGPFSPQRRNEFLRPHERWKRAQEDQIGSLKVPDENVDVVHRVKNDPQEDSEEFKQQLHKSFLRFSKLLNENLHLQKRYQDDKGKFTKLLCCVCGRLSKEFGDIHSLLAHSYDSRKVGLRTDHLGFHKALCFLNGWNWLVAPDNSKAYRRTTPPQIKALKEDLILWPPIVIIQNSSIGNKSNPKAVSVEAMEEIIKGIGFSAGTARVSRGKPANQSVLLVKFMPTFSGLQAAERLHKYYADKNRGRQGFQQLTSNNGDGRVEKDEELLYGYMAVAQDLDKLDPESKKRSVVKSRKDIEAIADARLKN